MNCWVEAGQYLRERGIGAGDDGMLEYLLHRGAVAGRRVSPEVLARALGIPDRSFRRQLRSAGLPAASRLLALGRILATIETMKRCGLTVKAAAYIHGWPEQFTFSNACIRHCGLRPTDADVWRSVVDGWLARQEEAVAA